MSDSEHNLQIQTHLVIRGRFMISFTKVDGPPIMPEDPYAYIMAAYGVPPSPDYIPGPEGTAAIECAKPSPTAESPGYIPESDPEEDPEEDPADYPADKG
ncbi:hypothetical protein Tco_0552782 [Tanacetum coccineum]